MNKVKTVWFCSNCGNKHFKWIGQCSLCKEWNTLQEEIEAPVVKPRYQVFSEKTNKPISLPEVTSQNVVRFSTKISECDRLLGGGLVPGALTLVGGDPGIGKSTLLLQLGCSLAKEGQTVLYVSGEESIEQTALRAKRLGLQNPHLFLLSETQISSIKAMIGSLNPRIVIIDSIQVVYKSEIASSPGSVSQVREIASDFMHLAKKEDISIFLIGHVTKTGELAGPKVLEHLVDTVLYFEGEKQHDFRIVRVVKNRFGPTDEIAMFQMETKGLVPIPNPSELFLREKKRDVAGSVIIPTLEGSRAFLIEVQALVTETGYATPTRRSAGVDPNRLSLLLAVLEKRMGYPLHRSDVFVSIAGGLRIHEPAIDLGILLAVASSLRNKIIDPETTITGEVGLGGEVRSVPRLDARLKEIKLMGFKRCLIPQRNRTKLSPASFQSIAIKSIDMVEEAIYELLG